MAGAGGVGFLYGIKVVKTLKIQVWLHGNEVKPLFFVVIDNIIAKLGRRASVLLLNVTNSKNHVFLQKLAKTGAISKIPENSQMHYCQHNLNQNYQSYQNEA